MKKRLLIHDLIADGHARPKRHPSTHQHDLRRAEQAARARFGQRPITVRLEGRASVLVVVDFGEFGGQRELVAERTPRGFSFREAA